MPNFDCGIYTITSPSGKQYVGSSREIKSRWYTHRRALRMGRHHCAALQRAHDKYGLDSLIFARVAIVQDTDLTLREQEQMDERRAAGFKLYNSYPEAASTAGRTLPPETLARATVRIRETLARPEIKAAMSAAKLGKPRTTEARAKQSATTRGRKVASSTTPYAGVQQMPNGKWRARVRVAGKTTHVGVFATPELANAAAILRRSELEQSE